MAGKRPVRRARRPVSGKGAGERAGGPANGRAGGGAHGILPRLHRLLNRIGISDRTIAVLRRVAVGTATDGFTHAGNLAYLSLLTLFPFFIVAAAVARLFGQSEETAHSISIFLRAVPPDVADALRKPIHDVLAARSGNLLWFGALVGLWSAAGFVETVRSVLWRAYRVRRDASFWEYRLGSIGLILGAVLLALTAFNAQVALVGAMEVIERVFPFADDTARLLSFSRIAPALALFVALYILFFSLTPRRFRGTGNPIWPGALCTTLWWMGTTAVLPRVIGLFGHYDLTYGSLAGVMIALIFFFLVGLGVVIGAELNAALAKPPGNGLDGRRQREVETA